MTCREIAEFMLDYELNELSEAQRALFDGHLSECPECVEYLRTYNHAAGLSRRAFVDGDHEDCAVPEKLVQAILAARAQKQS